MKDKLTKKCKAKGCNKLIPKGLKAYCSPQCATKASKARVKEKNSLKLEGNKRAWTYKRLKDEAWKMFSKYIRLKYSDSEGNCRCVTCHKKDHWKNMQAGHAISGRGGYVMFNEKVVRVQCYGCNVMAGGRYDSFVIYLTQVEKSITIEEYAKIKRESQNTHKISIGEMAEIYYKYKDLVDGIEGR